MEMIRSKTALITGASAGIGYELSKVNAKNGGMTGGRAKLTHCNEIR